MPVTSEPRRPIVPFNDLSVFEPELRAAIEEAIARVIKSKWYVLGPEVEAFESDFAAAMSVPHAIGVASGTDAISLALAAFGVGPGDEVVTSPLTAAFTAMAVSRLGAVPVFADVEPDSLCLSAISVAEHLTVRTKAILPVHLYGNASDMPGIMKLASDRGLVVVEDACQAHGARLDGKPLGSIGHAGTFSFYPTKNLGAFGDGGMVVTRDHAAADRLRQLRNGGQSSRYVHERIGLNSRLDELQAAILRAKLPHLEAWNDRRRALAGVYDEAFGEIAVHPRKTCLPARHLYVVSTDARDALAARLSESGIDTLIHYPVPTHLQAAYRDLGQGAGSCPEAERAADRIVSLPLYPSLQTEQQERVVSELSRYLSGGRDVPGS